MTLDPTDAFQLITGVLLGIIGWGVRQALNRLDTLEKMQGFNTGRLIRIETRLGIAETNGNHDVA